MSSSFYLNIGMTRKNLSGLNDLLSQNKRASRPEVSTMSKVNIYKYLEYNRPPTPSNRFRLKDNFMMESQNRVTSPPSRELDTIDILANQSSYSVTGTPMKDDQQPQFEQLPPKSPTPPPPPGCGRGGLPRPQPVHQPPRPGGPSASSSIEREGWLPSQPL